jgi:DNA-binding MarR family transcriptional regulator
VDDLKNFVSTKTGLGEKDEDRSVDIFKNVMRCRHIMQQKAADVAAGAGLHAAELNVIDILGKYGPIVMGRLARETFISPSNTTSTVKKLEQAELVIRRRSMSSDREVTVELTTKGRRVFRNCYPAILGDVFNFLSSRLSKNEIASLQKVLRKLAT